MIIYLMRHGQTDYNKKGLIQGKTNVPLNDFGRTQAIESKPIIDKLGIQIVYSGNLDRQIETAKLVTDNIEHIILDEFSEICFGEFEGTSVNTTFPLINKRLGLNLNGFGKDPSRVLCDAFYKADKTGKAESFETMATRFSKGIDKIIEQAKKNKHDRILIVSSGMAIGVIIAYLCPNFDKYSIKNCGVHSLEINDDGTYKADTVYKGIEKKS